MNPKSILIALLLLTCSADAAPGHGNIYHKGWIDLNKNGRKDIYEDPTQPIERRIDDLMDRMTVEEKTCQLATIYGYGAVLRDTLPTPAWREAIWKDGIGNIDEHLNGEWRHSALEYPYSRHAEALNEIQRFFVEETRLGIPVDFTNEGIRGVKHYKSTFFPAQIGMGCTWDRDLVRRVGRITGEEARALGYTNIYSPILDAARDQRWGRTVESYGEDPYLVSELGREQVLGIQEKRVVSTPKHFAIYSVNAGARDHEARTDPHATPQELYELHLEPFRVAIEEAGALGMMVAHNDYNGTPISADYHLLTEIVRNQWGFKGYIVSDSWQLNKNQVFHHVASSKEECVAQELHAGINVRTFFKPAEDFILMLRKALSEGIASHEDLDKRVREVLYVKFWLGLFDIPYVGNPKAADEIVNSDAHRAVALEAGRKSIVLLKNEGNLLPLKKDLKTVAVIGPMANDIPSMRSRYGSFKADVITGLEGIRRHLGNHTEVIYTKGCNVRDPHFPMSDVMYYPLSEAEQQGIDEAAETARKADVAIIFAGDDHRIIGESRTRVNLDLAGRQKELIRAVQATGTPVVVVLFNGRPATINWEQENVPAIIEAWYPGEFAGQAVAEVLWGDYNPGGKLSVTFPRSVGQIPWAFPFKPNARGRGNARVNDGLYPFGYGLSYTTFEISGLQLSATTIHDGEEITAVCKVKNTGDRTGDEVVQLYLNDNVSSISRWVKELCGFERVTLQPGEEKEVSFRIDRRAYGMYDAENRFVVEPGSFTVMIGNNSENTPLKAQFTVQ